MSNKVRRRAFRKVSKKSPPQKRKLSPSDQFRDTFDKLFVITHSSLEPTPEYYFHPERRWRFDWAWPDYKVAVEINGQGYGHGTIKAKKNDAEKLRVATLMDWSVLVYTSACIGSMVNREKAVYEVLDLIELRMGHLRKDKTGKLVRVVK